MTWKIQLSEGDIDKKEREKEKKITIQKARKNTFKRKKNKI